MPLIKVSCALLPRAACLPHATCNWGKLVLLATCIILPAIIHAASLANIQLNHEPATWQHIRALFPSPYFSLSPFITSFCLLCQLSTVMRAVFIATVAAPLSPVSRSLSPFPFQLFFYSRLPFCITRCHFALHFPHAIELRQQRFLCFSSCC